MAADGTGNYATIQAAVDNANSGDTIIVSPGTYYENIIINKIGLKDLELRSASGDPANTIIANSTGSHVISMSYGDNLTIKGFTISGAGTGNAGINMVGSHHCTIENNIFSNNALGVQLTSSSTYNTIRNNIFSKETAAGTAINIARSGSNEISGNTISNHSSGILIGGSDGNKLSSNIVSQSIEDGILLQANSKNNILENNLVSTSGRYGIYCANSVDNKLISNMVSNGTNGINLVFSPGSTISGNDVSFARDHAIFLDNSSNTNVENNSVSSSPYGIALRYSNNSNVVNNYAYNNTRGIYITLWSNNNMLSGNKAYSNNNGIVLVYSANNNIIENNEVNSNNNYGIVLGNVFENKVLNNKISQNDRGISLDDSSVKNTLSGNIVNSNRGYGIRLDNSDYNNITSNIVQSNKNGIYLVNSNNSYLINNTVPDSERAIQLWSSSNDKLINNILSNNRNYGILLDNSSNNELSGNTAFNSTVGISLSSSVDNNVSGNTISWNSNHGIFLCARSLNNLIYNNNFNNAVNTNVRNDKCTWNVANTSGRNIMGGPYLGGNYWAKPDGTGHSQITPDENNDGFADEPFITSNVTDNLPLIDVPDPIAPIADFSANPTKGIVPLTVEFKDLSKYATSISWDVNGDGKSDGNNSTLVYVYDTPGDYSATLTATNENGTSTKSITINAEEFIVYPVADFSANPMSGYTPLSVQFTDLSQNAISRNWDIGIDGTIESTNASFTYVFSVPGSYPVRLTAINENGTSSKDLTITATKKNSGGGGSRGGGGGGGGSPEPARNVDVKELSQVRVVSGNSVKFDFPKNATCVVYVSFDAKKTAGKTTTIAEQLKAKSTLTSNLSSGEVYKYFNLWVGNAGFATEKNIENPVVCFKVEKSWLEDKNIDQNSITLNRYSDKKWSELPVKLLREDSKYLYFKADTPGFTHFAITGNTIEKPTADTKPAAETSEPEEKNTTVNETKKEQNSQQGTGKDKVTSIPGFEGLCVVACLITLFLHKKK
ncbi:cell surface protein [Methanosarcina thermophila MST-A1]|uniref:Cell surface protein n=4 Tax=Methanosarcina thermophila TaxID=2210 RepID=A0A0E3H9T7_METTE|nr:NosD domain-containing protein [Methanosarcina thermophila]AKB12123.1 Cell surface protein [Methanosarcina thermophila TM-1]AKB14674.1 Cell surface protein [Methanosarcina thermophila CHTI-55]BAW29768.1 conserved hypothetical protein [Methanosarcina thermophila]GLI14679.1 cell surface protein [Methanosarcina thermophila MST-A1]HOA68747.1 NosD domain-containing protein [Methanosarcina thermophila]